MANTWELLEHQLGVVAQLEEGSKLAVDGDGSPSVHRNGSDWVTGVRRWYTGQGRMTSVVWLEGLAGRIKELASQLMFSAEEVDNDAASTRQSADVCPQCSRTSCSCVALGILAAMRDDIQSGVAGVHRLMVSYRNDREISRRGLLVVRSLEEMARKVSHFLSERQ